MGYETKVELRSDKTITLDGTQAKAVEGYYIGNRTTPDKGYGPGILHFFQTSTGVVGVWGKSRLNSLMTTDMVGRMCLVTFTGMSTPAKGRRAAYTYQLKFDRNNTIDVSNVEISDPAAEPEDSDTSYETAANDTDGYEPEADLGEEELPLDVAPVSRPVAPARRPTVATDPARAAKVQALLNGNRKRA